jgi:hypothetical protein
MPFSNVPACDRSLLGICLWHMSSGYARRQPESFVRTKPWEYSGMSRAGWYRAGKPEIQEIAAVWKERRGPDGKTSGLLVRRVNGTEGASPATPVESGSPPVGVHHYKQTFLHLLDHPHGGLGRAGTSR